MPLSKPIFIVLILVLFLAAPFACTQATTMTGSHGMAQCPQMNSAGSLCNAIPVQHIDAWESLFTVATPATTLLFLLFAFSLIVFASERFLKENPPGMASLLLKNRFAFSILDPLRLAFSRGILHSKRHGPSFIF